MSRASRVLHTGKTRTTGGRENGVSRSSDGHLDVRLATPGSARIGTNPEQLFAAGWSPCFEIAITLAARKRKIALPSDLAVDAEVDLNVANGRLLPERPVLHQAAGLSRETAQTLVKEAHEICPYSKAARGNLYVAVTLV